MIRHLLLVLLLTGGALAAQTRNLDIYWIDTEGGAATLIVTPDGQSLLIDSGNPTPDDRDAKRIYAAAQQAGLKKIDYLLTSHFHGDHVGGAPALAKMIPIDHFLDHGDSIDAADPRGNPVWEAYKTASAGNRMTVKAGDKLALSGLDTLVVASDGKTIAAPVNGGGPNPFCDGAQRKDRDTSENQRSAGILLTYGKFKFLDLGDLTWDVEMDLACPVNRLGTVTVFQTTHHGFLRGISGAPAHVWSLRPQVLVVNNGPTKGWEPSAWELAAKIQGLEGVWQDHLAVGSDAAHNTNPEMIANLETSAECQGRWVKASVAKDGKFTVTNSRNGFSKTYVAR